MCQKYWQVGRDYIYIYIIQHTRTNTECVKFIFVCGGSTLAIFCLLLKCLGIQFSNVQVRRQSYAMLFLAPNFFPCEKRIQLKWSVTCWEERPLGCFTSSLLTICPSRSESDGCKLSRKKNCSEENFSSTSRYRHNSLQSFHLLAPFSIFHCEKVCPSG